MKPNEERARAAMIMIWAVIAMELLVMVSNYLQYDLLLHFSQGDEYTTEQLENNDLRVKLVTIIYGIFFFMSAVTFIMWFRRAYFNLHQCTSYLYFKEGWAVAAWFVPIVNLFRPFTIMKELFEVSARLLNKAALQPKHFPVFYLSTWWILWLIDNAMIQILNRVVPAVDEVDVLAHESLFYMGQSAISIVSGLLLIKIIKTYNAREIILSKMQFAAVN
ncbi:DUF4328 domain-containing protein [Flavobacterium sp. JP2137]|uniref:DUF4328 domain-containing protein n=1 Tax=Flavobacterium sp. JP2137 TaxID=3414510 RepID=UPI003D2FA806